MEQSVRVCAAETPAWIVLSSVAWFAGAILAAGCLIASIVSGSPSLWLSTCLYLLFVVQLWAMLRRVGSFSFVTSLLYPMPLLFYQAVFARSAVLSALGRRVKWKGRELDTETRRK